MIRSNREFKGGCGEVVFRPESTEEIAELERIFPRQEIPGQLRKAEWLEGDKLRVWTELDPNWKPPVLTPPAPTRDPNVVEPAPTQAQLVDRKLEDLITMAAELSPWGCVHRPGEKKAELAAKIITAWNKRNQEVPR